MERNLIRNNTLVSIAAFFSVVLSVYFKRRLGFSSIKMRVHSTNQIEMNLPKDWIVDRWLDVLNLSGMLSNLCTSNFEHRSLCGLELSFWKFDTTFNTIWRLISVNLGTETRLVMDQEIENTWNDSVPYLKMFTNACNREVSKSNIDINRNLIVQQTIEILDLYFCGNFLDQLHLLF